MNDQISVTHFLATVAGYRIVVALNLQTSATLKHIQAYVDSLKNRLGRATTLANIQQEIKTDYPTCTFIEDLPEGAKSHHII